MEFLPFSNQQVFFPRIPLIGLRQVPPLSNFSISTTFPFPLPMESFTVSRPKDKVVFVLGSSGTGKSKLAISLAAHFGAEIVNSDKMQVYDGLDVITNKVTDEERAGIPHHLIGGVHPDADFTSADFCREAMRAVESIIGRGRLPVVAGGSNSYIEELVDGNGGEFRSKYECCFVWVDVDLPVLHTFVSARVDKMVEMGLVDEARGVFDPEADYSKGIRRSIGVPEMDRYLRAEGSADEEAKARLLEAAIDEIKVNTCKLTCCQLQKIHRLSTLAGWDVHRVDATEVFLKQDKETEEAWERVVKGPSVEIVGRFLNKDETEKNETLDTVVFNTAATMENNVSVTTAAATDANGTTDAMTENYGLATATVAAAIETNGTEVAMTKNCEWFAAAAATYDAKGTTVITTTENCATATAAAAATTDHTKCTKVARTENCACDTATTITPEAKVPAAVGASNI